ncbi:MAG: signal recognition particle-docking protein FtsY [Hyphomicrobiaceae bacterium]
MSEPREKKRGLFGRLFGGRDAVPDDEAKRAPSEAAPTEIAEAKPSAVEPAITSASVAAPEPEVPAAPPVIQPAATTASPEAAVAIVEAAPKTGWFQRLKTGLSKTSSRLSDGITSIFNKRKLDAATLDDLEDLLIQADLGVETATAITDAIGKGRFEKGISADEVKAILAAEVEKVLAPVAKPLDVASGRRPHVVLVVGVNGTGKTTTIGKLAERLRRDGLKVMLAAGDTFRAAAIDQLKIWGERTGAPVVARAVGADASGLAFDALKQAQSEGMDVLLLDTAGRLQNKQGLMDELEKVIRVLRKIDPEAPHDCVLVLDATTGQNALSQVEVFREKAGVTGLVMTKLDGTARGGILVAIAARHQMPVHAIGVGEGVEDLQPFDPGEFARAIAAS